MHTPDGDPDASPKLREVQRRLAENAASVTNESDVVAEVLEEELGGLEDSEPESYSDLVKKVAVLETKLGNPTVPPMLYFLCNPMLSGSTGSVAARQPEGALSFRATSSSRIRRAVSWIRLQNGLLHWPVEPSCCLPDPLLHRQR